MTEIALLPSDIDNLLLEAFSDVCNSLGFNLPSSMTADLVSVLLLALSSCH